MLSRTSAPTSGTISSKTSGYSLFLQTQTQDISLLRILQLSRIVLHPYVCTMCVCVCVYVCMCAHVCTHTRILHIVMLKPLLLCTLCVSFVKLWITFSTLMYIMYVMFVQCLGVVSAVAELLSTTTTTKMQALLNQQLQVQHYKECLQLKSSLFALPNGNQHTQTFFKLQTKGKLFTRCQMEINTLKHSLSCKPKENFSLDAFYSIYITNINTLCSASDTLSLQIALTTLHCWFPRLFCFGCIYME